MKTSVRAAFCGILTALAVLFMLLVPVLPILVYCCPLLSGLCVAFAVEECGVRHSFGVFAAASILSLILVADKEAVIVFILFTGAYPILKNIVKSVKTPGRIAVKLLFINAAAVAYYFAATAVFAVPRDSFGDAPILLLLLTNVIMLIYDKVIDKYCLVYRNRFRKK